MFTSPLFSAAHTLGVVGFGNPIMLLWALAGVIPVLLHWWRRAVRRESRWAAMDFLLAAQAASQRRSRIDEWLLLLVRIAIPCLLALALAEPYWETSSASVPASKPAQHIVLVLDTSFSMAFRDRQGTWLATAQERACELVQRSAAGDGFSLIALESPSRLVVAGPEYDGQYVVDRIRALSTAQTPADLSSALDLVESLVPHQQRTPLRMRIYFVTDLQATTWATAFETAVRARLQRLNETASVHLVDVGRDGATNTCVSDVKLRRGLPLAGEQVEFEVTVANYGSEDVRNVSLEWIADGQVDEQRGIDVMAHSIAVARFSHRFKPHAGFGQRLSNAPIGAVPSDDSAGANDDPRPTVIHTFEARLAEDSLPLDNRRYVAAPVDPVLRVLCIGRNESSWYFATAIGSQRSVSAPVLVDRVEPQEAESLAWERYRLVALCNLAALGERLSAQLDAYLASCGAVVHFLGDQVRADRYNLLARPGSVGGFLLPCRITRIVPPGSFSLRWADDSHALLVPFRGYAETLQSTPVWRYPRLELFDGAPAYVVISYQNGDPAVVEKRDTCGRTLVVAIPVDDASTGRSFDPGAWSAWAVWPSFLPLAHQIAQWAATGRWEAYAGSVGQSINGPPLTSRAVRGSPDPARSVGPSINGPPLAGATDAESSVVYYDLSGRPAGAVNVDGRTHKWFVATTDQSGIYLVGAPAVDSASAAFAVNVDPRESDLRRVDRTLLSGILSFSEASPQAPQASAGQHGRGRAWSAWILWALLAMILLETVVRSAQFARPRPVHRIRAVARLVVLRSLFRQRKR